MEKCEDIAEYITPRPLSGMNKIPLMFPATIVANCKVNNFLFGMIPDFSSKTFPFFDQKWHDSENLNDKMWHLNKNHCNDYKYNTPIFKCPFLNKGHTNSYIPTTSKKNIDDRILNKNVKTCKVKCVPKDSSKEKITKETGTLQTSKELNGNSKRKVVDNNIKNTQSLEIAPFLQPKYWFYRKEIWNQRCKYIIKSAVQNQILREYLCSIFSKNTHESLQKPSTCLRKKVKIVKNKTKNTRAIEIFKSNNIVLKNDKKKVKLNNNYKINNSDRKITSNKQKVLQMSLHAKKRKIDSPLKEICGYIDKKEEFREENNATVSKCETTEQKLNKFNEVDTGINCCLEIHDRSKNSSNDNVNDECLVMEELNCIVSGSVVYTTDKNDSEDSNKIQINTNIYNKTNVKSNCKSFNSNKDYCNKHKRNNLNQCEEITEINLTSREKDFNAVTTVNFQPHAFYQSPFSIENLPQNKYERGQSQEHHTTLKECCEQETLQKINNISNLDISSPTLVSYESSVKNNRLDLLEKMNKDYNMSSIITPTGSYKENDKLERLERIDKDGDFVTIIPASKDNESCAESYDRLELIEEINNNSNFVISKPISGSYESCEKSYKLGILEDIDEENSLDISRPASGDYESCTESDKLDHIKELDDDRFLVTSRPTSRGYGSCEESEKLEVLEVVDEDNNIDISRPVSGGYENFTESNRLGLIKEINEDSNLSTSGSYENCEERVELLEKRDKEGGVRMCRSYSRSCECYSESDILRELLEEIDEVKSLGQNRSDSEDYECYVESNSQNEQVEEIVDERSLGISTSTSTNYENCAERSRLNMEEIDEESDFNISKDLKNSMKSNVVQPTSCDGLHDCFNSASIHSAKSLSKYHQNKLEEVRLHLVTY